MKPEFIEKLKREKNEIEMLKQEIKKTEYHSKLKSQDIWKLDNYGLPRIISWGKLLENSILKASIFSKVYGLYSNYAHSEFISIIQINESSLSKFDKFNLNTTITTLNNVIALNCVAIILFKNKFECAKNAYDEIDENLKFSIEFWYKFATN